MPKKSTFVKTWECSMCTLINPVLSTTCQACGEQRRTCNLPGQVRSSPSKSHQFEFDMLQLFQQAHIENPVYAKNRLGRKGISVDSIFKSNIDELMSFGLTHSDATLVFNFIQSDSTNQNKAGSPSSVIAAAPDTEALQPGAAFNDLSVPSSMRPTSDSNPTKTSSSKKKKKSFVHQSLSKGLPGHKVKSQVGGEEKMNPVTAGAKSQVEHVGMPIEEKEKIVHRRNTNDNIDFTRRPRLDQEDFFDFMRMSHLAEVDDAEDKKGILEEAHVFRKKGNRLFSSNIELAIIEYQHALNFYWHGYSLDSRSSQSEFREYLAKTHNNIAMCHFKLAQFQLCVEDCDAALKIDPSFSKALYRRVHVYLKLQMWSEAKHDILKLINEKKHRNSLAKSEFELLSSMLAKLEENAPTLQQHSQPTTSPKQCPPAYADIPSVADIEQKASQEYKKAEKKRLKREKEKHRKIQRKSNTPNTNKETQYAEPVSVLTSPEAREQMKTRLSTSPSSPNISIDASARGEEDTKQDSVTVSLGEDFDQEETSKLECDSPISMDKDEQSDSNQCRLSSKEKKKQKKKLKQKLQRQEKLEKKKQEEAEEEEGTPMSEPAEVVGQSTVLQSKTEAKMAKELSQEELVQQSIDDFLKSSSRPSNIQALLSIRDPKEYASLIDLGEEEDEEEGVPVNDGVPAEPLRTVDIEEDSQQTSSIYNPGRDVEDDEESIDFNNFDSNFEAALWEIELTDPVVRWFKKNRKKNLKLCGQVVQRLKTLANGYWNERNHKPLAGTKGVNLYEANLSSGQRILWEVAINLSERLNLFQSTSNTPDNSSCGVGTIHAEMIRVWAIVEDHDNLKREIANVEKCHQRGRGCLVQSQLIPTSSTNERTTKDKDGVAQIVPKTFSAATIEEATPLLEEEYDAEDKSTETDNRHYHLGSSNPNEYNLLKFYSFNSHMLGCLFGGNDRSDTSLPFKMTSKEYEVARLKASNPLDACGILLMGRSGTGKTSVQCYRLAFDWVDYWNKAVDNEPLLLASMSPLMNNPASASQHEDISLLPDAPSPSSGTAASEDESMGMQYSHLKQIFITKSMCLRTEVQRVARDLMHGGRVRGPISELKGVDDLDDFSNIPSDRYPLFTTISEFLLCLDRTLEGGRFVTRISTNSTHSAELSGLAAYFEMEDDDEEDDDIEDGVDGINKEFENSELDTSGLRERSAHQEMTWTQFLLKVWPKLEKRNVSKVDASLLWTEINSSLKGSVGALKVLAEYNASSLFEKRLKALKEEYEAGGKKQSAIPIEQREHIWALFVQYEEKRMKHHFFDRNDLVANLYRRVLDHGTAGVFFHKLYIDEVQDFTMAELYFIFQFTDPNHSFLAGDTAQTIARGIGFRFSDLRSLFKQMNDQVKADLEKDSKRDLIHTPSPYSLTTSYRSHTGVLKLASSVVEVLYKYFPRAIDNLGLDRGLFEGPKPKILLVEDVAELTVMLLGSQTNNTGRIDFGDEQVILVRDDEARKQVPPSLAESSIVLTIFEAKGLEFNTVLLWNFFGDSSASKEWRVLHSYWDSMYKVREAGSDGGGGGGGEIRQESFDTMDGGGGKNRPLDFEEGKYTILESELKALYCALTRARINIWIVDFDKEKRKPAFRWFIEAGLADVINKENATTLSTMSSGDQSSCASFQKRGLYFLGIAFDHEKPEGLLEAAATCFRKAGATDLQDFVKARLAYLRAITSYQQFTGTKSSRRLSASVEYEMLEAVKVCLQCQGTVLLPKLAAKLLSKLKRHELSGLVYSSVNNLVCSRKAAEEFEKANLPNRRGEELCKVIDHIQTQLIKLQSLLPPTTEKAAEKHMMQMERLTTLREHYLTITSKHFKSRRQYGEAISMMERFGIQPTDDLLKLQLKATIKMISKMDLSTILSDELTLAQIPETLRKELDRLAVDDAVEMLLSDGRAGCLEIATILLCENDRRAEAADVLQRHFSYHNAAAVYGQVGDSSSRAKCLILNCIDALSVSFDFPVSQLFNSNKQLETSQNNPLTFKTLKQVHFNNLVEANKILAPELHWLGTIGCGLQQLLNPSKGAIHSILDKISLLMSEDANDENSETISSFCFAFDRWLLIENGCSVLFADGDIMRHMLEKYIPSMIKIIESLLKGEAMMSEEMALYYGLDMTHTGDPMVVEFGKTSGSRLVMGLCEKFNVALFPSLARNGNVRANKSDIANILCVHLYRAIVQFCSKFTKQNRVIYKGNIHNKNLKLDLTSETVNVLSAYALLDQAQALMPLLGSKFDSSQTEHILSSSLKSELQRLDLVQVFKSFSNSLFDVQADPWAVEDFLSKHMNPNLAMKICEVVKTVWIERFFVDRKHANSARMITKLWSSSILANAIEKKSSDSRSSSSFTRLVQEVEDRDLRWNKSRKASYYNQYNGFRPGAIIFSKTFITQDGITIYPKEIGYVVKSLKNGKVCVKFESGYEIYCPPSMVYVPFPLHSQFDQFQRCLKGEFNSDGNFCTSGASIILVNLIRSLCFKATSNPPSLSCDNNMENEHNSAAVNHLLELAVTLILAMLAASSSQASGEIHIPNLLVKKHLREPLTRVVVNTTDTDKTKPKQRKFKQGTGTWGAALSSLKSNQPKNPQNLASDEGNKESRSTFAILKDIVKRCKDNSVKKKILADIKIALKSLVFFLEARSFAVAQSSNSSSSSSSLSAASSDGHRGMNGHQLEVLLLTLLANIPSYSYLVGQSMNSMIRSLVRSLNSLGLTEVRSWKQTGEAARSLVKVLKENKMIGSESESGIVSLYVRDASKFVVVEAEANDFMSDSKIRIAHEKGHVSKQEKLNAQASDFIPAYVRHREEEDLNESMDDGTDLDAMMAQEKEKSEEESEKRRAVRVLETWWLQQLSKLRDTTGDNHRQAAPDIRQQTLKSLQEELDPILATDLFRCKLCKVDLKGKDFEEHLKFIESSSMINNSPPLQPSLSQATNLIYQNNPVEFIDYTDTGNCRLRRPTEPGVYCFFANPDEVVVQPSAANMEYYDAKFRYSELLLDHERQEVNVANGKVQSALNSGADEEHVEQLRSIALEVARRYDIAFQSLLFDWHCSGSCRHNNHVNQENHNSLFDKLHRFRETTETKTLEVIVDAILITREVGSFIKQQSNKELSEKEETEKDEIELEFSKLDSLMNETKDFLKRARNKKTFSTPNVVKMIEKKKSQLQSAATQLQALLCNAMSTDNRDESMKDSDGEDAGAIFDHEDEEDDIEDGADNQGGDDFVVQAPKKNKKNKNKSRNKKGGLVKSKHVKSKK